MSGQINRQNDQYSDKLAKLLPAEGTAALIAIANLVPNEAGTDIWLLAAFLVIGVFVWVWSRKIRKVTDTAQLGFILVGYIVWAANVMSGRFEDYYQEAFGDVWFSFVPALIAILYSLFIPLVFSPEK